MKTRKFFNRLLCCILVCSIQLIPYTCMLYTLRDWLKPNPYYSVLFAVLCTIFIIITMSPLDKKLDTWFRHRYNNWLYNRVYSILEGITNEEIIRIFTQRASQTYANNKFYIK